MSTYNWVLINGMAPEDVPVPGWLVGWDADRGAVLAPTNLMKWTTIPGFSGTVIENLRDLLRAFLEVEPPEGHQLTIYWSVSSQRIYTVRLFYTPFGTPELPGRSKCPEWALKVMPKHQGLLSARLLPGPPTAYDMLMREP